MSEKDQVQNSETDEQDSSSEPAFFEFKGRRFDNQESLTAFIEGVTMSQGRLAQQNDELKREVEPFRKYNLKGVTVDEAQIMKQVGEMRDEGNHVEADRLMLEFTRQIKSDTDVKREKDRMWSDYVKARRERVFDVIDEDLARDHIFNNYDDKLQETDDPFGLIDRILEPKANAKRPSSEPAQPTATLGAGNTPSVPATPSSSSDEPTPGAAMDAVFEEFDNVWKPKK